MSDFQSEYAYRDFARSVRNQRRWIFEGKAAQFLDSVRKASHSREYLLKAESPLWRCQRGSKFELQTVEEGEDKHDIEMECPMSLEQMVPNTQFVKAGGRANPPGFVYLYLANRPETAMVEMRPWVGESLSVTLFKTLKDVRVVLCQAKSEDPFERINLTGKKLLAEKIDKYVWEDISSAFARPVSRADTERDYAPTQILAEAFKAEGFGGIVYESGLSKGLNVVLFDIQSAKPIKNHLYALKCASHTFTAHDPHFAIVTQKDGTFDHLTTLTSETP